MDILDKPEYAELRHFFERAEQRLFSRKFMLFAAVIAVLGLAGSLAAMLPFFQNAAIRFIEQVLFRGAIDREVWRANLFTAAFAFICIFALAAAFLVSVENENSIIKKAHIPLTAALLFTILFYIALITYYYGHYWINSDSTAELLGAKTLAEENALFSTKWYYGTEFWFIYRQPFAILLFKIFNDWPLVRAINTFLMLLSFALAFLFMMRQTKVRFKYSLLACCFLFVPLSYDYWRDEMVDQFYIFFFIKIFLMTGCFLSFIKQNEKSLAGTVRLVLFYALAFICGVEGPRIFFNFLVPLALTVFLAAYFDVIKEKRTACRAIFTALVFSCIGYLVNAKVLKNIFMFASLSPLFDDLSLGNTFLYIDKLPYIQGSGFFDKFNIILFNVYANFWGYTSAQVLRIKGFLSIVSLLLFALSVVAFTRLLKNTFTAQKKPLFAELCRTSSVEYFLLVFTAVSLIFNFLFFLFVYSGYIAFRYFLATLIFLFAAFPVFMGLFVRVKLRAVHSFLWIAVFALLFGHGFHTFYIITQPSANKNANLAGYLSFLEKNSLSYGFASVWNADVTTELSNGRVEMVTLANTMFDSSRELIRYKNLNPAKYDNPYYHKGKAFLLLSKDEWEARKDRAIYEGKTPAYEDDFFVVLIYPEAAVIHREIMGETF